MSARVDEEPGGDARLSALLSQAAEALAAADRTGAILMLQKAVRVAPANGPIHHDLGFLCLQAGRRTEAVAALRTALALDPAFAQASLCLGIALQDQGDAQGAESAYRRALLLQPGLIVAYVCLGALLESRGHTAQAIEVFRAGARRGPGLLWGRLADARALLAGDGDGEVEPKLRQLTAQHPGNGMAHEMLATLLANAGRFAEARAGYERAIAASPGLEGCYYDLARCRRIDTGDHELLERMRGALDSPALAPDARLKVHLALGKAVDDLGDPAAAMRHYAAADAVRSELSRFDSRAFEARIERLIAHFGAARFNGCDAHGNAAAAAMVPAPICIVGLPRSGTTLVEQILSSHPQVHGAGELPFWTRYGADWERDASLDSAALGAEYASLLRTRAPQAARATDKMPLNILWAGLIHQALPQATLVYCRRRPIDVALSIHRTYFNPQVAFPTGGAALVAAIRAVERLGAHWLAVLPADRFIQIDYEQLVGDPEAIIRRLLAGCSLPWDDACLRPEQNRRTIKTPSKWQARQPIHRGGIDSWRRYAPWLGALAALEMHDA